MADVSESQFNTLDVGGWIAPVTSKRPPESLVNEYREQPSFSEVVRVLDALPRKRFDAYPECMNVGIALHHTFAGDDVGRILWEDFCKQSKKYEPDWCEEKWDTIADNCSEPLTFGSLWYWAFGDSKQRFKTFNLDQLLKGEFKVDYLIDDVLVDGQPCMCAGPQKSLKTTLLLWMGLCLSRGADFLGHNCKGKRRVLFMSGESGMATLQKKSKLMLEKLGGERDADSFHLSPNLPRFDQPLDELEALLVEKSIEVLMIDPVYLCVDGSDAGNMFVMGQQYSKIANLCTKLKITPILAHHVTKNAGKEFKPPEISDMAWAGVGEFARQWLLLGRRSGFRDGTGRHELFLRAGGSAGHSGLYHVNVNEGVRPSWTWEVEVESWAEVAAGKDESKYQAFVEKLRKIDFKEPMTRNQIHEQGIDKRYLKDNIDRLVEDGILVEAGNKSRYPIYTLGDQDKP